MLRCTPNLCRWHKMMYHREALPLKKGSRWKGQWGAMSIRYSRTIYAEKLTGSTLCTIVDRQALSHLHESKARQEQMYYGYSRKSPTTYRNRITGQELRRRNDRQLRASFIHFMQFKTMQTLQERAGLASRYGQAAVNKALGDPATLSADESERKWNGIRRKVVQPGPVATAPKFQATMRQIMADRFDNKIHIN